jgi:hypothetical protein
MTDSVVVYVEEPENSCKPTQIPSEKFLLKVADETKFKTLVEKAQIAFHVDSIKSFKYEEARNNFRIVQSEQSLVEYLEKPAPKKLMLNKYNLSSGEISPGIIYICIPSFSHHTVSYIFTLAGTGIVQDLTRDGEPLQEPSAGIKASTSVKDDCRILFTPYKKEPATPANMKPNRLVYSTSKSPKGELLSTL